MPHRGGFVADLSSERCMQQSIDYAAGRSEMGSCAYNSANVSTAQRQHSTITLELRSEPKGGNWRHRVNVPRPVLFSRSHVNHDFWYMQKNGARLVAAALSEVEWRERDRRSVPTPLSRR